MMGESFLHFLGLLFIGCLGYSAYSFVSWVIGWFA